MQTARTNAQSFKQ